MTFFVEGISQRLGRQVKVRRIGEYRTAEDAVAVARNMIEKFLRGEFKRGMDAEKLFSVYRMNAEHPYVFRDDGDTFNVPGFNHDYYAKIRAEEICNGKI